MSSVFDWDTSEINEEYELFLRTSDINSVNREKNYVEDVIPLFDDKTFQKHFRIRRDIVYSLIGNLYFLI